MKKCSHIINRTLVLFAFLCIIIFPKISFNGVLSGLKLWAEVIVPGLFPAMIITSCILYLFPLKPGLSYLYICIIGLLCGFPAGAFLCSQLHEANPDETLCEHLIPFCNLSSPSFVMNYIVLSLSDNSYPFFLFLLCIYLPAIECLIIIFFIYRKQIRKNICPKENTHNIVSSFELLDNSIWNAITNMLKLGGYIIIFSCLSAYICILPVKNIYITGIICGITEITNGIYIINHFPVNTFYKTLIILAINSFGGLSTIMQTAGITKRSSFRIKKYICGKLLLTVLTILHVCILF